VTRNYFDQTRATSFNLVILARPIFPSEARRSTPCDSKCPCDVGGLSYQSMSGARTDAQADSSAAAFPGSHAVRTRAASPNSRYVWPAKPPVSAACFASEPRTARWSCHGRLISRPRAEMTLAARMSPLPRTSTQAWLVSKNAPSASEGGSGTRDAMFPALSLY